MHRREPTEFPDNSSVIVIVDVVLHKQNHLSVGNIAVMEIIMVDGFGFEGAEEGFHWRVVPTVSLSGKTQGHPFGLQQVQELRIRVCPSSVGMQQNPFKGTDIGLEVLNGVKDEFRVASDSWNRRRFHR